MCETNLMDTINSDCEKILHNLTTLRLSASRNTINNSEYYNDAYKSIALAIVTLNKKVKPKPNLFG